MRFKSSFSFSKQVSVLLLILGLSFFIPNGAVQAQSQKTAAQFEQSLQMLTNTLEQLQAKGVGETNTQTRRQESTTVLQTRLNEQIEQLLAIDDQVLAEFAALEEFLREKNLPDLIWKRHFDAQDAYQKRLETLLEALDALQIASDAQSVQVHAGQALELLQSQKPPTQPAFDPSLAPFGLPKTAPRAPFENETELQQWLSGSNTDSGFDNTRKATRGGQSYSTPITPDIQKLALKLGHSPLAIYNWAYDNLVFVPTYGVISGVDKTLDTKQGNAFEIASVMVALLRASGVEAKYGIGTVNIGIERVKKWLGADSANAAINMLAQARIPIRMVVSGGQIKSLKIEHIWAEGFLDFEPGKGTKHQTPDTWIPLDASFKQHRIVPGTNLTELVPFDIDALRDHLIATTQVDARGGVFGIDSSYLKNRLSAYQAQLQDYIKSNEINPADLVEKTVIVPANRPELAAGLPYEIVTRTDMVDEIGAHLTHQLTIKFYQSQSAQNLDNPTLSYTFPLPAIGTQRLSVTYVPATEADAEALEQFRNSDATELPLYLFNVKPQLQLDGTVLAEGTAIGMGLPQYYTLTLSNPHDSYSAHGTATAGDEIVFGVNGSGMTPELVQKRLDAVPSDTAAENMHQAGLHFWMEHDLFDKIAAQAFSVHVQRMPSVGSFSIPLSVSYFFGIPRSGNYRSRQVDVKLNLQIVVAPTDTARFNFMSQIGMHGSYLEGSVLDQLFGLQRQPGISAAQLLMEANDQGIPIYTITADNVNTIRPILNVGEDVQLDITNAIHAGKQVIVPQRELVHGNWKGAGYIIQDPVTGEGVYLLSGGLNGGGHETCFISVTPVVHPMSLTSQVTQQLLADAFLAFLYTYMSLIDQVISEAITDSDASEQMMTAFRVLEATVTTIVSPQVVKSGCLWIEANGIKRDELYVAFERDKQTGAYFKGVTVEFTSGMAKDCYGPSWDFGDGSPTVHYPDPIPHTYKETGKYEATLTATCNTTSNGTREQVEVKVDVYVSKVEMDVREHHYPVNQIAQRDPRLRKNTDWEAENKLLVWHNGNNDEMTFDVVKHDRNSVFWVEILKAYAPWEGFTREYPYTQLFFGKVTTDLQSFTSEVIPFNIKYQGDILVKYGIESDNATSLDPLTRKPVKSLMGDEIKGEYEIYGITPAEYQDSFYMMNFYLFAPLVGLSELGYVLVYRVAHGIFQNSFTNNRISGKNYIPNSTSETITMNAYVALTHICGAEFTDKPDIYLSRGTKIRPDGETIQTHQEDPLQRYKYPNADATLPIYYYTEDSDAASLVFRNTIFKDTIFEYVRKILSYDDISQKFGTGNEGETKILTFPIEWILFKFPAAGSIGLGDVELENPEKNQLTLSVKRVGNQFEIGSQVEISMEMEDIFDYNYFNRYSVIAEWSRAPRSAAIMQCGFNKTGAVQSHPGQGQIGLVRIKLKGSIEGDVIIKTPE
jgi:PKD repeat protein